jgi:lysylphosphatidylglycerol synthetase-like protein (DUF2156 family)
MVQVILFLIFAAINFVVARKKGFSPWAWILAAGILGLLAISFIPSANELGITEQAHTDRKKAGNLAGVLISAFAVSILVFYLMTIPNI